METIRTTGDLKQDTEQQMKMCWPHSRQTLSKMPDNHKIRKGGAAGGWFHEGNQTAHQKRGKHHADYQSHGAGSVQQAAARQGTGGGQPPIFRTLYATLFDIAAADSGFNSPYLAKCEKKRCLYIVIAGDRGLAGGYNSNILKAIEADAEGADYCVLPIGKKAVEYFERHKIRILTTAFAEAGDMSVSDCFEISRLVCQKFLEGAFDEIRIAFTQFISMLTQTATVLPVLPFDAAPPEPGHEHESLMLYEPDSAAVFDAIIPEYLAGVVYGALCESVASEQGARRTAMDSATKNAGEMIEHLNLYITAPVRQLSRRKSPR